MLVIAQTYMLGPAAFGRPSNGPCQRLEITEANIEGDINLLHPLRPVSQQNRLADETKFRSTAFTLRCLSQQPNFKLFSGGLLHRSRFKLFWLPYWSL